MTAFKLFDKQVVTAPEVDSTCKGCVFDTFEYKGEEMGEDNDCALEFDDTFPDALKCNNEVIYKEALTSILNKL